MVYNSKASEALLPFHGSIEACAACPKNSILKSINAKELCTSAIVLAPGCQLIFTSTSSHKPALTIQILPKNFSSLGVPKNFIVPLIFPSAINSLIAIAAPKLPAPNKLWPQPCPAAPSTRGDLVGNAFCEIPGKASNSPKTLITGFPEPYVATKAVGIPATPLTTVKPCFSA